MDEVVNLFLGCYTSKCEKSQNHCTLMRILTSFHGRRNFKDTNPLMSSLLVIFVWGGEAIL
jgi:hypothetical protein